MVLKQKQSKNLIMASYISSSLKQKLFLIIPAIILLVVSLAVEYSVIQQTGRSAYPIDDPYIHMAMARHFAQDGVFGVSKAGFSASSSSPLWTLLLSASFIVIGVHESLPWLLNLFFGLILAFILTRMLSERLQSSWAAAFLCIAIIFVLPLPTLVALGMEHTLHILLMLLIMGFACKSLLNQDDASTVILALLVMLSVMVRFESVFVAAPLVMIGLFARKWRLVLIVIAACAGPILIQGIININQGWFFFPSSVMLKSVIQGSGWEKILDVPDRLYGQLLGTPHLTVLFMFSIAALLSALHRSGSIINRDSIWSLTFLGAVILHCSCASTGWFYRYEAYLITIGLIGLTPLIRETFIALRGKWRNIQSTSERYLFGGVLCGLVILSPAPFYKNILSIRLLVPAARNMYHQQYQMGLFLREYYQNQAVLANDIGAINFLADIDCLDIMGLGSLEPIQARMVGTWSPRILHSWCMLRKAPVAMVYESWIKNVLPSVWIKVGEWTITEKVSVADSTVSFFAIIPQHAETLCANLKEFEARLPDGVILKLIDNQP